MWKWSAPLKIGLFLWLDLADKVLTWDNFTKSGGIGPNICVLCLSKGESINHIFVHFSLRRFGRILKVFLSLRAFKSLYL